VSHPAGTVRAVVVEIERLTESSGEVVDQINRLIPQLKPAWDPVNGARLAALLDSPTVVPPEWQGHAVIVGHGRVGSVIAAMFREQGVRYAVVEADRRIVDHLVAENVPAVRGDIADNTVIKAVALERARLLAFAIPDSYQLRAALEHVRAANPHLDIVVRTHSEADGKFLEDAGVGMVVMGERELALQMGEYGLRSMGIDAAAARQAVVARQPTVIA